MASAPPAARVGLMADQHAVESEITRSSCVKGSPAHVPSIDWQPIGPKQSTAASPTTTLGGSANVPTLTAPRATLSPRGRRFQLWVACAASVGWGHAARAPRRSQLNMPRRHLWPSLTSLLIHGGQPKVECSVVAQRLPGMGSPTPLRVLLRPVPRQRGWVH